ncbi:MAG TPA: prenyltransferase/squalene oxidase repeat-containing protein [Phycisphaerae bacterium]|nr:prenyltransferase/squalene oxidase repeat-containing protein [Phycisphaerae bacterium]
MSAIPILSATLSSILLAATPGTTPADAGRAATQPVDMAELRRQAGPPIDKAMRYFVDRQAADGGWKGMFGEGSDPAISALIALTFIQHPDYGPKHPITQRAVRFILGFQQPDGGIYNPQIGYGNYTTSIALTTLAAMKDDSLKDIIRKAQVWLKNNQWSEDKTDDKEKAVTASHPWYGGAGYGGDKKRPDLSNTQMMIEALHASGLPADDPVYKRALKFIERCQMSSGTNDQPFARGATDGGFIYSPANEGESKAETYDDHGTQRLRSYGSMTYAGFKSLLYAGVSRNDPRVRQAWEWIRRRYTLKENPNMPGERSYEGLYYYYHVFAKALAAWGEPAIIDAKGVVHDWRRDLIAELARRQRNDGSWVNVADRWQEGNPNLVTAYSVLALHAAIR